MRARQPSLRAFSLLIGAALVAGCQQKMARQPSYKPLEPTAFFPDGQMARPLVPGTMARGHLRTDWALFTGKLAPESPDRSVRAAVLGAADPSAVGATAALLAEQAGEVDTFPFPITRAMLAHGHNRFMIYCVVCHDPLGTGQGKIVERGYTAPPSYHIPRLRAAPVGHFFNVMTHGYGSMPSYAEQIPTRDRWAIAAYIRALQLSQHFPAGQLTAQARREVDKQVALAAAERGRP